MRMFDPTTPAGRVFLSFDLRDFLANTDVTVEGCSLAIAVHDRSLVPDANPSACLEGALVTIGSAAGVWFSHGQLNVDYVLTYTFSLSDESVEPMEGMIQIRKYI